jgi:glycosyltransferase involved in cell wall biosynthesis
VRIVFVLLTYGPDEPAGIERSIAALAYGLRTSGHGAWVLAAGPPTSADGPEIARLSSLSLPRPATETDLMTAINGAPGVGCEVSDVVADLRADLVCWVDATWGLGYLAPHPGIATALMVRVLRTDLYLQQALAHRPDHVLTNSDFLIREATKAGLDTGGWHAVPNALLAPGGPPTEAQRESLRRHGPVRIVARAEPHKGIAELIAACPQDLDHDVEIVLATAGFEYWQGMQHDVQRECSLVARQRPRVRLLPELAWDRVQPFLAGAACTVIASTAPETFCNTALEALSVATPVVTFDLGHVPTLIGPAGTVVPVERGARGLWQAVQDLLADRDRYQRASTEGPLRAAPYQPQSVAETFLDAVCPGRSDVREAVR